MIRAMVTMTAYTIRNDMPLYVMHSVPQDPAMKPWLALRVRDIGDASL